MTDDALMTNTVYFFDSYATVEMIQGNEQYRKYTESSMITTKLNLFEVVYALMKNTDEKKADEWLDDYYAFAIDFDKDIIKKAAAFRLLHKRRNLSMADCIGYCLARRWNIPFLTGDKEFRDLEHVEFVR